MRVLIRVDEGPDIGLGYAMRCIAVADALERRGVDVSVKTTA